MSVLNLRMKAAAIAASFMIALTGCNSSDTSDSTNNTDPSLKSLEISVVDTKSLLKGTKKVVVNPGSDLYVESTGILIDGTPVDVTDDVQWLLNGVSITLTAGAIRVSEEEQGPLIISSTSQGVDSNVLTVEINHSSIEFVEVAADGDYYYNGSMQQYAAYAHYVGGTSADITTQVEWNSSNDSSTIINEEGFAFSVHSGESQIIAAFEGIYSDSVSHTTEEEQVQTETGVLGVVISNGQASIGVNESFNYKAVAGFTNGDLRYVTDEVEWHSTDSSVATVVEGGQATGVKFGTVEISASLGGKESDSGTLNVIGDDAHETIAELWVTPNNATIAEGGTRTYSSKALFLDGRYEDVTHLVSWVSTNENIATISSKGFATGVNSGTTQVYAMLDNYDGVPVNLHVSSSEIDEISIDIDSQNMKAGTTKQLTATAHYSDGNSEDITDIATWTTGESRVLTINDQGKAAAHDAGVASVVVSLDGVRSSSMLMFVNDSGILTLSLSANTTLMNVGESTQATSIVWYAINDYEDVTSQSIWTSANPSVVTVNRTTGQLVAKGAGTTEVYAVFDNAISDQPIQVTVK